MLQHALPDRSAPASVGVPALRGRETVVAARLRVAFGDVEEGLAWEALRNLPEPRSHEAQRWKSRIQAVVVEH